MYRNQCGRRAGGFGNQLVAAPAGKQIGVVAISQRNAGDRHVGAQRLFNQISFEGTRETAAPALFGGTAMMGCSCLAMLVLASCETREHAAL